MYCPLCKAEYRAGFDTCSDCLVGLVSTREQAEAANVIRLWGGTSQSKFRDIVGALRDANIPNLARSGARAERTPSMWEYIPIISSFARLKQMHDQMSWEVFVLQSDYSKATEVVENKS